ncbi:MAG: MarR family winged helix-turn-helix transcriptional regulator [Pseudoramibacter sp.]
MFTEPLAEIYKKLRLYFYREVALQSSSDALSFAEAFCIEAIYSLGEPTINTFAQFMNISSPNATYKVNSLVQKGYLKKVRSEKDHREYHLLVTDKFLKFHETNNRGYQRTMDRIFQNFSDSELDTLNQFMTRINDQLVEPLSH